MSMSRRRAMASMGALGTAGAAGIALSGWDFTGSPRPAVLRSAVPLPEPFRRPLPILPVLRPASVGKDGVRYEMELAEADVEILPGMKTRVWGYGATFPGPTLELRRDRPALVHQRNALPVPISTHLHGGHTPAASDGFPTDLVRPGSDHVYAYPIAQRAATLWYHDHRMDHTGRQVWRGLAGAAIVRDDEEDALPLPKGDREYTLMIQDRSFGPDGSMEYPMEPHREKADMAGMGEMSGMVKTAYAGGLMGDVVLVNGAPWPVLEVEAVRYRFRLINGSNARRYALRLDPPPPGGRGLVQIGGDGGLLAAPVAHEEIPIAPGERYDVVVDFSRYRSGTAVTLRNAAASGGPSRVMRFQVTRRGRDDAAVPARLSEIEPLARERATVRRAFRFRGGDVHGRSGWVVNGRGFDPGHSIASPRLGAVEIWKLTSTERHPVHLHLNPFQVLSRRYGPPGGHERGWKDTVELTPGDTVEIITRFDGYRGKYLIHCHNLEHEDMAMMAAFDIV
jgi:spore coat protein A, manganese oxidase